MTLRCLTELLNKCWSRSVGFLDDWTANLSAFHIRCHEILFEHIEPAGSAKLCLATLAALVCASLYHTYTRTNVAA
jgi:hypothetical protein